MEFGLMRNHALAILCSLFVFFQALGQQRPKLQLSQIPNGDLSGNTYMNHAFGLSYQIPAGWKGDPDPKDVSIDWRGPKKPANRCSRMLLSLTPAVTIEGRFKPIVNVFVTDPACIGVAAFPVSVDEIKEINKVAKKIGDNFNYTPFMSPYGNEVHPFSSQGRVMIQATGAMLINALDGEHQKIKEPIEVKTSFTFTESNGYLVVWAFVADVTSFEVLKKIEVAFKPIPAS